MKAEVAVLGSTSLIVIDMVSVDLKQRLKKLRNCVKVEVAVQGSSSLRVLMASGHRSDDDDGPAARFLMKKPQSVDVGHSL